MNCLFKGQYGSHRFIFNIIRFININNNINPNAISNINTNANPNFKKKSFNNDDKLLNIIDSTPKKYIKINNNENDTESFA